MWNSSVNMFARTGENRAKDDEETLRWAALQRSPTYIQARTSFFRNVAGEVSLVDVRNLEIQEKGQVLDKLIDAVNEDTELFFNRIRKRFNAVDLEFPKVEVRFQDLRVDAFIHVGGRALPTIPNFIFNMTEAFLGRLRIFPGRRKKLSILNNINGIIRPSRLTLLLGPPSSGKTTLLLALAGRPGPGLQMAGNITYNGHDLKEFVPQRTSAYVSQQDWHMAEMTVRETLDFSGRCQGVGFKHIIAMLNVKHENTVTDMLLELLKREKENRTIPDEDLDIFIKALALGEQKTSLVVEYIMKILGLDICADTLVGDEMIKGISGGQKKRLTTGELLVGASRVLLMDEISTGLDSSTTREIIKYLRYATHALDGTTIISLLQPDPETFELFDDIILLSEGQIVYQGPREAALEFFAHMGFQCPDRKNVADFLQEVLSEKDQEQYWFPDIYYQYVPVAKFADAFKSFWVGNALSQDLAVPFDRRYNHPAALSTSTYGTVYCILQLLFSIVIMMTVFFRTTMHHNSLVDGGVYLGALYFAMVMILFNGFMEVPMLIAKLPVIYKHRDLRFYPCWVYTLPSWVLSMPTSLVESFIWVAATYYTVGFDPQITRCLQQFIVYFFLHQMSIGLFRVMASLGRNMIVANTFGSFALLVVMALGGFILSRDSIPSWWIWGYWFSPLMYAQNAASVNEFLGHSWDKRAGNYTSLSLGEMLLKARSLFPEGYWFWIGVGALLGYTILFNILFTLALTYLNPLASYQAVVSKKKPGHKAKGVESEYAIIELGEFLQHSHSYTGRDVKNQRGMVLPFQPLSMAFSNLSYYVDVPVEMKKQGVVVDRLQLLVNVSGAFQPGVLTALVGISGAGKTTLMDVLAGRKTGGIIEGSIYISGYPKKQETFARISGYCEQNDIHSPCLTIHESLMFSSWLRLSSHLLLMKRGGKLIYAGPLGTRSCKLIQYFEAIQGVPKIKSGYNPAAWILEVSSPAEEIRLGVDFAEVYQKSSLFQKNKDLVEQLSNPHRETKDLHFPSKYSRSFFAQLLACLWKQNLSYWRNPQYTAVRFFYTVIISLMFGTICWRFGSKRDNQQDIFNAMGSMYAAVLFIGITNATAVQPVVYVERFVSYRERAAGMYSALPFAFAQVIIEFPYVLVQSVIYSAIFYFMASFEWTLLKFMYYCYFMYFTLLYFTFFGMMTIAVTPNHNIAAILAAPFYMMWNLFSGFMIPHMRIPIWWRWYYWANPIAWSLYGLLTSQYGDMEESVKLSDGIQSVPIKKLLEDQFGYRHDFLGITAIVVVGFCLLFSVIFAYAIKSFNFQRR
ncbi:hypothetical protein RHGRI_020719 [Rhododendron griersonianum]|uniref:ABC transporter domain-containing protein n=1 Tax=Rhododendron griersonianum TaxID=479676 RepID=A0AAV6JKP6_9ERIC|nr:hypothetical protein RHGRI_020719 [Rhododendron griersonianum]